MKLRLLLLCFLTLLLGSINAQPLIQGTIKKGSNDQQVEIWLKPNFSNSTQYLAQIGLPIAIPAAAAPQPTSISVTQDPSFTGAFGTNYTVTINPVASNTGNTENYFNVVLIRSGGGASNAQSWTEGVEFKVLTVTFNYSGAPATFQTKLADYQDGGSDGQGYFYTADGNANYYITTNSVQNFYASPNNSIVGGNGAAGYAQIMAVVNAGTVSGTSPLCIGASATYSSNGDIGGTWSSSNTAVATVNAISGLVNAVGAGTTNITYTISGVSAFKTLTVNPNVSAGTVSGSSPLCIGASTTYSSNGTAGGSWSSSNTAVATVDAVSGLVTAVGAGTSNITYTVNSGCGSPVSSFATLTVNSNVSAGTVSGTSPLIIGQTDTYTSNGTAGGSWSSSNTSAATVNSTTGLVTAVGAGNTNITYTVNSGCGSPVSSFKALTVNAPTNAGTVSGASPLCIGASTTYSSNGDAGGSWSSTNTSVATVNATTGLVTAVGAGTTDITYTINGVSAFKTLTVNPNASAGTVTGSSPLCIGVSTSFSSNGTSGGTWSSANTGVATVDPNSGLVTAIGAGSTNITYTVYSGCGSPVSAFASVTVNPNVTAGTVSGTSPLTIGQTDTYISNGTAGGSWSSSNTSVATVNSTTGLVSAVGAGNTNITYNVNTGCGSPVSSFKALTVNAPTNAGTVSGTSPLCIGASATYSSNGDAGGSWSSTNTSVGTVNASSGLVTAVAAGTTDITYTVNGVSAFKTLTVNPSVSAGTVSGTSPLCIDGTATYTSNGAAGGTWSSSNTSVATVNASTGLVTAVGTGIANISYTVNTGCGSPVSSFKTLTVNALPVVAAITGNTTITAGSTSQLSDATAGGTWSSNNTGVATVNASTGLVTAVAKGTATINFAVTNGCGTTAVSTTVTVDALVQNLIQGTIKPGAAPNEVEFWLKPDFSNSTQYLYQIGMPIAWPVSAAQPSNVTVTLDPTFISNFGNNYAVSVYAVAHNTANTENYRTIVLIRGGDGASELQTWTAGTEFKVLTVTFNPSSSPASKVKLADYQDGGSDGQGYFYTASGNANYYVTSNSIGNFYAAPGLSIVGGNASAGYAETNNTVGCTNPTVDPITGTTTVCTGATTQLSSTTAGGTWSSNNTGVATVNPTTGVVNGVATGTATITYLVSNACGSNSVTALVTVNGKPTVAAISGTTTVCDGSTTQLSSTTAGGTWSSSNTAAATVDQSGLVTGVGGGTTTISYELSNSCGTTTVTANVTVNTAPAVAAITGTTTITVGGSSTLSSATAGGTWSSGTTSVATINASTGKVTAVAPGTSLISYTVTNSCGPTTVTATVTVEAAIVKLIQGTIKPGAASNDIEVWLKPNFNNNTEYLAQIVMPIAWSALSANQPTSLNVTLDPNFIATFGNNYTVSLYPLSNNTGYTEKFIDIVLIRNGDGASDPQTWIADTEIKVLTASFIPSTAPNGPVKLADYQDGGSNGQGYFYTASGIANYFVSSNSIENFYASPGKSIVGGNASAGYAQTISNIGCTAPVVAPITGITTVCVGSTTQLSSTTPGGVWSSNNASATVNSDGLVSGVSAGSAEISYTVTTACGTTTVTKTVTVNGNGNAGIVSGTTPLCIGATAQYSSTGTAGGTWSSSNPSIATVNATTGVVTAKATGTTNITYTVNGCNGQVSSFQVLTVTTGTAGNPGIVNGPSPQCTESVVKYTSTGSSGGTWSSSNTTVAIVNTKNGQVTTVGVGTTNIIYTVEGCGGPLSAFKTLTVTGPPTVSASNITVNLANSNCTQMVSFGSNVTATNATNIVYKIGNKVITSPVAFPTGQTLVTINASNNCGTIISSFVVTVKDLIDPVISCSGNITTTSTNSCTRSVMTPNPIFRDNCKIMTLAWKMTGATTGSSSTTGMNYVGTKTFNTGVTKVTYTVWDASENAASCSFTVTVTPSGKCTTTNSLEEKITINKIIVSAFPNPSNQFFQLRINSSNRKDEVYIKIMDITGRQLQQFKGQADKLYRFGDGLAAGTYVVEVRQGTQRTTAKVVKAN